MPGRGDYRAEHTQNEINELFERLVGSKETAAYAARIAALRLNGETIGSQKVRLARPDSIFYEKSYNEAIAVARTIVRLGIDDSIAGLWTSDAPDVIARRIDGSYFYVEHSFCGDEDAIAFPRRLELASVELAQLAKADVELGHLVAQGYLEARVVDPGRESRGKPIALASELSAMRERWKNGASLLKPHPATAPALAAHRAQIFYKVDGPANTTYFRPQGGLVIERDFGPDVLRSLAKKRADAAGFDPGKRPLWLLLSIAAETFNTFGTSRESIRAALEGADLDPYDRVLVETLDGPPILVDRRDS